MNVHTPAPELRRRPHEPLPVHPRDPAFPEVMLYFGSDCNRDCYFCCVNGRPGGAFRAFGDPLVDRVLEMIRPDARIKLYGGEPTLHHRHLIRVTRRLRDGGYRGRLTIFSNGIQADRLIRMLEADPPADSHPGSDAYLNHAIWHGRGVAPLPQGRRERLLGWAAHNPRRLFLSHEDILPVGGAEDDPPAVAPRQVPDFDGRCARCFPTIRSDGRVHACAFAAEVDAPQYDLGSVADDPERIAERHQAFLAWVETELEPAAAAAGESPCQTCLRWARGGRLVQLRAD